MTYKVLIILLLLLAIYFYGDRVIKVYYIRKLLWPSIAALFIPCLVVFSKTAVTAAAKGIDLWFNIVFPSLFPFFVGAEFLNRTGVVKAFGILLEPIMRPLFNVPGCGSFTFAMGITSGYPVGAKITTDMRQEKMVTKTEAERLIAFTNNSGPLFIVGAVGVGMYNMPGIGVFLLICHILACVTVGMIFRFYGKKETAIHSLNFHSLGVRFRNELFFGHNSKGFNLGMVLGDAVRNSIMTLLSIGGFIIVFSVLINLLLEAGIIDLLAAAASIPLAPLGIGNDLIKSLLCGFFEITTGTNTASKVVNASFMQQLMATSMIIGWAGLSVHSQVLSIIHESDISIKPYLMGKFLQGVIAALYTFIGIKITGLAFLNPKPVFSPSRIPQTLEWFDYLASSCKSFAYILAVMALCTLILVCTNNILKLFRKQLF